MRMRIPFLILISRRSRAASLFYGLPFRVRMHRLIADVCTHLSFLLIASLAQIHTIYGAASYFMTRHHLRDQRTELPFIFDIADMGAR